MKTICAWCHKLLKGNVDSERTKHGICTPCLMREMDAIGLDEVQDILDHLENQERCREREMCPT